MSKQNSSHTTSLIFPDLSEETRKHCFGCGPLNPQGLHLHFTLDDSNPQAITASATTQLTKLHQGPPGYVHGGIIATLLDEAMSKLNRALDVVAMTRHMEVDYLRPVPLGVDFTIVSQHVRREGRKLFHTAQIIGPDGKVLSTGKAVFIVLESMVAVAKH